jgi:hypothetical protein
MRESYSVRGSVHKFMSHICLARLFLSVEVALNLKLKLRALKINFNMFG